MATLQYHKCEKCGYKVMADNRGHYSLMSGEYYTFSCHHCKEIIVLSADELSTMRYFPTCPKCGENEELWNWNPIDGHCPKCNGKMKVVSGTIMID